MAQAAQLQTTATETGTSVSLWREYIQLDEMNCRRKMEEFEEQARIRQQNREKARQANEESKRQFEEHMRFLRERRFGFDEDVNEWRGVQRENGQGTGRAGSIDARTTAGNGTG